MSLGARILGAVARRRARFHYERVRPEMPVSQLYEMLAPGHGLDLLSADGFRQLWLAHAAATPDDLWSATPPAPPAPIARAQRGEATVLTRTFTVTPATDWHTEPFHGVRWPAVHVDSCPFSLPGGDLGLLWHLNRMSCLVDFAAAYRATRDEAIADRITALMESWARANPYLVGANWLSPMETGLRLFAWSIALAGIRDAPAPSPDRCQTILRSMFRQARFLAAHFSRWAIPNNHLVGEAATLSAFAAYWPLLRPAPEWMEQSSATLVEEAGRQVLADGFHFENSVNYHLVTLDFFLLHLHARLVRGETPDRAILDAAMAMADAALSLVAPSGRMPMIGDDSMPHLVVIAGRMGSPGPVSGHVTFEDFLRLEHARLFTTTPWGRELLELRRPVVESRRFREAGIDVARDEHSHLVFTHGPQHDRPFSQGHLHADAGSFELELAGVPLIVDPGSYLYDGPPGLRAHMRSARAHNSVIVDGVEPMTPSATFAWQSIATGDPLGFGMTDGVVATGCRRQLPARQGAGVDHARCLIRAGSTVVMVDLLGPRDVVAGAAPVAALYFHTALAPESAVVEGTRVRLTDPAQFVRVFEVLEDPGVTVEVIDRPGDPDAMCSTMYGEVSTATTIRVTVPVPQPVLLVSVLREPTVAVTRTRMGVGEIGCAIEDGHVRRVLRVRVDPFAVYAGGRLIAGDDES
ncbi:MAG TPA: alginate lyase family protein, partial [Candidatus Krumholzibacteria bacterium]